MSDYVIMTDSSCDLPASLADEMELSVLPLSVYIEDKQYINYLDEREIAFSEIYAKLRTKCPAKTSAVNMNDFLEPMEQIVSTGKDLIYIGFSSGLSGTYNAGAAAAKEISEKYPDRKILAVDSLCASLGQGLLVYHAWLQKKAGKTIDELYQWVVDNRLHLCHMFTIDDLMFLKRGGRVSGATAVVGSMLSIKPIMHVDDEGHLIKIGTARGRKASIKALADAAGQKGIDLQNQIIFISHGDCVEDANYLGDIMRERFHVKDVLVNYVGPVIGAHSGPGTIALFFLGTER
ncbi:MAG: DegV family protein [Clostridia bacterium]|nr:DegV family protein [Clostridia bacterium]